MSNNERLALAVATFTHDSWLNAEVLMDQEKYPYLKRVLEWKRAGGDSPGMRYPTIHQRLRQNVLNGILLLCKVGFLNVLYNQLRD